MITNKTLSNHSFRHRRILIAPLLFTLAVSVAFPTQVGAVSYGVNLLVNGNAEEGTASSTGDPVPVPGWSVSSAFTVVPYGAPGFPTVSQGPPDAMNQFFAGGNADLSTATQEIDVTANAADIDAEKVVCDVSGYLGGFDTQDDNATLVVSFQAGDGSELGNTQIGPVLAADRSSLTRLVQRLSSVPVPAGTRSIVVMLIMQRVSGTFNDGYADSLSVVLRAPAVVTNTADSGPGSLRDAVAGGTTITFDPQVFSQANGPQTITLQTALPNLEGSFTIIGPGADLLTVQRSSESSTPKFRLFIVALNVTPMPTVVISGVTLANGNVIDTGGGGGGAMFVGSANCTLNDCVLTGNSADVAGAISIGNGNVALNRCTISNNTAGSDGALRNEAYNGLPSTLSLTNCTVTGNTATDFGQSAITNQSDQATVTATLNVVSCTVAGNTAAIEQFALGGTAVAYLTNSIFAENGQNFISAMLGSETYVSNGFNLSDGNDFTTLNQTGDRNNTDPMLGPLQDNGGRVPTRALLPGSPAIDKGNTIFTTDGRGFPRPIDDPGSINGGGNNSDIGAYEFGSSPKALGNISTRLAVQTGDNVLIGGFIVTGSDPKNVIVRAIGPSLPVTGHLLNPTLELHDSTGAVIASNDDWVNSPDKQAIIDSTIPPTNDLESAIVASLPANGSGYTAIVRGVNNTTGVGLVEVYDLDPAANSKLANISTRGFVSTADNVMIAGTIVVGATPQKVLIRAIGPSLTLAGKLADPTLELRDANGELLDANDNWGDSPNKQAIIDTGIPPTSDLESAVIATLPANNSAYTTIVQGANGATGIGLVEVYALF